MALLAEHRNQQSALCIQLLVGPNALRVDSCVLECLIGTGETVEAVAHFLGF